MHPVLIDAPQTHFRIRFLPHQLKRSRPESGMFKRLRKRCRSVFRLRLRRGGDFVDLRGTIAAVTIAAAESQSALPFLETMSALLPCWQEH